MREILDLRSVRFPFLCDWQFDFDGGAHHEGDNKGKWTLYETSAITDQPNPTFESTGFQMVDKQLVDKTIGIGVETGIVLPYYHLDMQDMKYVFKQGVSKPPHWPNATTLRHTLNFPVSYLPSTGEVIEISLTLGFSCEDPAYFTDAPVIVFDISSFTKSAVEVAKTLTNAGRAAGGGGNSVTPTDYLVTWVYKALVSDLAKIKTATVAIDINFNFSGWSLENPASIVTQISGLITLYWFTARVKPTLVAG